MASDNVYALVTILSWDLAFVASAAAASPSPGFE
jgi:hypothetical protein